MKNQALFYSEDKSKKLKCRLLQFLFVALRVNRYHGEVESHILKNFPMSNYSLFNRPLKCWCDIVPSTVYSCLPIFSLVSLCSFFCHCTLLRLKKLRRGCITSVPVS